MHILRYRRAGSPDARVGVLAEDRIVELDGVGSLGALWSLPVEAAREQAENAGGAESAPGDVVVLAPIDGRTEVWACGVTYEISREARREESEQSADIYQRVYDAQRPEIFFKSAAWRVAGDGQPIAVRADSGINVPEPEVAPAYDHAEITGIAAAHSAFELVSAMAAARQGDPSAHVSAVSLTASTRTPSTPIRIHHGMAIVSQSPAAFSAWAGRNRAGQPAITGMAIMRPRPMRHPRPRSRVGSERLTSSQSCMATRADPASTIAQDNTNSKSNTRITSRIGAPSRGRAGR